MTDWRIFLRCLLFCAVLVGQSGMAGQVTAQNVFDGFTGQLMAAAPRQTDPIFANTVIFVIEHDATGGFGLIINRPAGDVPISELFRLMEIEPIDIDFNVPLFFGGPAEPEAALLLHEAASAVPESQAINSDYVITGWKDILSRIDRDGIPSRAVFTLGAVIWSPGQLEREVIEGAWTSHDATPDRLFSDDPLGLWERVMKGQSSRL